MSQASLRYQADPPANGPPAAALASAMPSTTRLRAALLEQAARASAGQAQASATRRSRAAAAPSSTPAVAAAAAQPSGEAEAPPAPRRSSRRKRAPAPAAAAAAAAPTSHEETTDPPPAKKQKRGNLKSPPPASGNAKSDGSEPAQEETTASCCICMDEPKPSDLASINGCEHLFCFECIEKWAERENSCPLCKVRFTKIDRVNKAKKKKGEAAKNTKKVKQKDQRSDIATGAALEGLLASFASSASFPHQRVARLIFSGIGHTSGNPFAVLPGAARRAAAGGTSLEDSLFSSDTDDEEGSFMPGASSFAEFFRSVPRAPGIIVSTGLGGRHGINVTLGGDPPTGRSYASNGGDSNAGRQAENPLEIEDDSDEEDIEVVQVTRPI